MARIKLTGNSISAIERDFANSDRDDLIYWDSEVRGLGLRLRRAGSRAWVYQYKVAGVDRRIKLGPFPEISPKVARELARKQIAAVWSGNDPAQERREAKAKAAAPVLTLKVVIDNYLAAKESKLRPASLSEAKRYLYTHWRSLHGWPIVEIQLPQVADIIDRLEKTGPVSAARSRSQLSSLYKWAMGRGYVQHNPVIASLNPDPRVGRDRVLSDDELRQIWNACEGVARDYCHIVRLLILTGQRRTEIGGMRWSELNTNDRTWTIPGERSKNGNQHTLTLPQAFWSIIDSIPRRDGIDQLFGFSARGYRNWNIPKQALDRRCSIPPWTHHDIRRTVATRMADIGIQPHVIEAVLNHQSGHKGGVARVYNRSAYTREVKVALAMWSEHVASIIGGAERKLIQFPA
jgi:integrase